MKNFISKLEARTLITIFIIFFSYLFLFLLLFVSVPEENKEIINIVTGAVIVSGVGAIIGFYYNNSRNKDRLINEKPSPDEK